MTAPGEYLVVKLFSGGSTVMSSHGDLDSALESVKATTDRDCLLAVDGPDERYWVRGGEGL